MRMSGEREAVLVVGIGNVLLGDEGLGVHVARSLLAEQNRLPAGVSVIEAGTALLDVVPEMSRYSRVILVDAIRAGHEAGAIYRAELFADLCGQLQSFPPLSLHDWGAVDTLRAAKLLGLLPPWVTLIGAEPDSIQPGMELSAKLARAGERIITMLFDELGAQRAEARATQATG